jgi:hypothetical protein
MGLMLDSRQRAQLAEVASGEKPVRNWCWTRTIELLAEGRSPKAMAANRAYTSVDELAERAVDYLDGLTEGHFRPRSTGYLPR